MSNLIPILCRYTAFGTSAGRKLGETVKNDEPGILYIYYEDGVF